VYPGSSAEVKAMMPYLIEKVPKGWTKVPNHDFEVFATRNMDVPILGFRKDGRSFMSMFFAMSLSTPPMRSK
jgi:hypothetical protein